MLGRGHVAITAVVPAYNEEAHIGACLYSLLRQTQFDGELEIVVVDGCSTDRTVDVVRSFAEYGTRIRLLINERRLAVHAWNMALREARGTYFAMIAARAEYSPTYFADCLDVMRRTGAAAVGGVQRAYGDGMLGRATAWCMSNRLGVGNARYRYTTREEEAESLFAMFTRRDLLEELGGFDETLPFDEDSDLNYRLRRRGGRLVVSPHIRVRYAVRRSLRALWKQMYRYGYCRRFTQLKHPRAVPLRVYVPAALVGALVISVVTAAMRNWLITAFVPGAYAAFIIVAALLSIARTGVAAFFVPAVLTTMHVGYGLGYWNAFIAERLALQRRHVHKLSH